MKSSISAMACATWIVLVASCFSSSERCCGLPEPQGEYDARDCKAVEVNLLQTMVKLKKNSDDALVSPHEDEVAPRPDGENNICIDGHMVPQLYVLGAQKAATTSLSAELTKGGVIMYHEMYEDGQMENQKEHHVFDISTRVAAGRDRWSKSYLPCRHHVRIVAGDATPDYFATKDAPTVMMGWYGSLATQIMFVVLLREPLARMQSAWYHNKRMGLYLQSNVTFRQHVREVLEDPRARDDSNVFQYSQYYKMLSNWFATFDSHQFIIAPYLYEVARDSGEPSISLYITARLGLLSVQGDAPRVNSHPHPDLDFDLPPGSRIRGGVEDLLANTTGPHLLANLFARHPADLYNYTGSLSDEGEIAAWLANHWG